MTGNKTIEYVLLLTSVCCLFLAAAPAKAARISELTESITPNLLFQVPSWDGVSPNGTTYRFSLRSLIENNNIVTSNYVGEVTLTTLNATDLVISGASSLSTLTLTGEATIPTINTVDIVSSRLASFATLTLSGEATIPTLNSVDIVSSRLASLATLTVSGEATLPTINAVNIIATGETLLEELLVTGEAGVATLNAIDITASGEVSFASLDVSGEATMATLNVTDLVVSGNISVGGASFTSLAVTGASALNATSTTALNVSGNANVTGNLTVNGKTVDVVNTEWTDWTPVYTGSGTLAYSTVTTDYAKYKVVGDIVYFTLATSTGNMTGTGTIVYITPPVTISGGDFSPLAEIQVAYAAIYDNTYKAGKVLIRRTSNKLEVMLSTDANYENGTGRTINTSGWYYQ